MYRAVMCDPKPKPNKKIYRKSKSKVWNCVPCFSQARKGQSLQVSSRREDPILTPLRVLRMQRRQAKAGPSDKFPQVSLQAPCRLLISRKVPTLIAPPLPIRVPRPPHLSSDAPPATPSSQHLHPAGAITKFSVFAISDEVSLLSLLDPRVQVMLT